MFQLRTRLKKVLAKVGTTLLWGVRQQIFEELLKNDAIRPDAKYDAIIRLSHSCNIQDLAVMGNLGLIRGSAHDASILKHYALHGSWASRTIRPLNDFFSRHAGGTYIDIGANIGLTIIPIGRRSGVRCIGIEAEPRNFAYLRENVAVAGVGHSVTLRNVAVFSRHSTLEMELAPSNLGDHRIRPQVAAVALEEEHRRSVVLVAAESLDTIISGVDPDFACLAAPLAVKIDVQGAEPFVFEGGQRLLAAAGLLIVEYSPYCMARMQADPEHILKFLSSHFTHLRIAQQEKDAPSAPMPISDAIVYLRRFAENNADRPCEYLDIIAER